MSNEEQLPTKKPKMEPSTQIDFGRKNDLVKLLRQLEKLSGPSITALMEVLEDPKADPKLKVDVAKTLLATRVSISESISKDQLSRSIAQARLVMASAPKVSIKDVEEDEERPRVSFNPNVILDVSKTLAL